MTVPYGRAILNEVAERLERDVAAGAVQATLERLECKSLVQSTLGSGTPIRDGRARRFYTVSAWWNATLYPSRRCGPIPTELTRGNGARIARTRRRFSASIPMCPMKPFSAGC